MTLKKIPETGEGKGLPAWVDCKDKQGVMDLEVFYNEEYGGYVVCFKNIRQLSAINDTLDKAFYSFAHSLTNFIFGEMLQLDNLGEDSKKLYPHLFELQDLVRKGRP